jgi:cytochrome c5
MAPTEARLAEMYARSCRACHTVLDAKAPLTGDRADWDVRFAQGIDTLVAHARDGFKAMPARGQCLDCTDDDLKQLTLFMAGRTP